MRDELCCISVAECFVFNTYNLVRGRYLHICLSLDLSHHKGLQTGPVVHVSDHSVPTKLESDCFGGYKRRSSTDCKVCVMGHITLFGSYRRRRGNFKMFSPPPGEEKWTLAALR